MKTHYFVAILISLIVISSGPAFAATPSNTGENTTLTEQSHKKLDYVAQAQSMQLKTTARLYINPITVDFDKKWLRSHKRELDENYKTRIQEDYSEMLSKKISDAMESRFVIVDIPDNADYIAQISLADLRINGPDNDIRRQHFVRRVGSATLHISVLDSVSLSPILVIRDTHSTRENITPSLRPATRVFNRNDFNHLFKRWAKTVSKLVEAL